MAQDTQLCKDKKKFISPTGNDLQNRLCGVFICEGSDGSCHKLFLGDLFSTRVKQVSDFSFIAYTDKP